MMNESSYSAGMSLGPGGGDERHWVVYYCLLTLRKGVFAHPRSIVQSRYYLELEVR